MAATVAEDKQTAQADAAAEDVIEIRDPEVDVPAIMAQVRANVAARKAAGAYREDLDAIVRDVFSSVPDPAVVPGGPGGSSLARNLVDVNRRWMVREVPFASHAPVVGPLIVRVRRFWNWMAPKWYVRAILQQQVGFNGSAVQVINDLVANQNQLAEEVRRLAGIVEQQRAEIARLRQGGQPTPGKDA
jgi:hypothetical protein